MEFERSEEVIKFPNTTINFEGTNDVIRSIKKERNSISFSADGHKFKLNTEGILANETEEELILPHLDGIRELMHLIFEFEVTTSNINLENPLISRNEFFEKEHAIIKNRKINMKKLRFPLNLHILKDHDSASKYSTPILDDTKKVYIKKLFSRIEHFRKKRDVDMAFPIAKIKAKFINIDDNEKEKEVIVNMTASKPETMKKIIEDAIQRTTIRKKMENL